MSRIVFLIAGAASLAAALSGCAAAPRPYGGGPCAADPGGYQCEIRRYGNT